MGRRREGRRHAVQAWPRCNRPVLTYPAQLRNDVRPSRAAAANFEQIPRLALDLVLPVEHYGIVAVRGVLNTVGHNAGAPQDGG